MVATLGSVLGSEAGWHMLVLALCSLLLAAAWVLSPADGGLAIGGTKLPELCTFRRVTGIPCPGCGLSRSWVAAAHGELRASLAAHPAGLLTMLYAGLQALRHAAWLLLAALRGRIERWGRLLDLGIWALGALLLASWGRIFF